MLRVLADPWDPGFGMGFSADDDVPATSVDSTVEQTAWTEPIPGRDGGRWRIGFVDGVRRIEVRLLLADGQRRVAGALGSFGVGCAFAGVDAGFGPSRIVRRFVAGGGIQPGTGIRARIGSVEIVWEPVTIAGDDDLVAQAAIQNEMRAAEAALAASLAGDAVDVVLIDGPLGIPGAAAAPIVGIVKRSMRRYLDDAESALLPRLDAGTRTPLFLLGEPGSGSERFSWYTRIAPMRSSWHDHAGLVRGEIAASSSLDDAVALADRVTAALPAYAGSLVDPRTPQNLGPVAGLERRLRHTLGDQTLLRRAAIASLTRAQGALR